jgi:hypothetical protein
MKVFEIGKVDTTLFTHKQGNDLIVCQIYVDDMISGSANQVWVDDFSRIMTKRFKISMVVELKFFLRFRIKQLQDGTFLSQTKYIHDMLKKFDMKNAKPIKTPMPSNGHLDLNEEERMLIKRYISP